MNAALAILAGGKGSRLGKPKAQITLAGEPVLRFLHARFNWTGPTMLVTAPGREHPPGADLFDAEVVDPVPGQGPLRGVLTGLENAACPIMLFATVDMPGVEATQLSWILSSLNSRPNALGIMCSRSTRGASPAVGQVEPFPCAIRVAAIDAVRRRLQSDQRSVQSLLHEPGFRLLPAPPEWDDDVWVNLNTPEDIENYARVRSRHP